MSLLFEELDYRETPIGAVSLRRRRIIGLNQELYEIKLGEEYLMSSLFTESEIALGRLGIQEHAGSDLQVVVGGLGLGYTAQAVLESDRVSSLLVVDALQAVIDWHTEGLLPLGAILTADSRCRFTLTDFFAAAASPDGFDPEQPQRRFDAVLVDIDHSPSQWLDSHNSSFYQPAGLSKLARHLNPGGVFGLWSNEPPDEKFTRQLRSVFATARAEAIVFHNPIQDREFTQSVYLATIN